MICPVCEQAQEQGDTCDNCGKQLAPKPPAPLTVEPIPELEPTRAPAVGSVPILPLRRLERGREPRDVDPASLQADIYLSEDEELHDVCPNCATPGRPGLRCAACGVLLPRAEA